MVVIIEPVIPERFIKADADKHVYREVTNAVTLVLVEIERQFGLGTRTWSSSNQPAWKKRITRGADIVGSVLTGSKPFVYVEAGTRVRYRRMSRDFIAKTTPGVLASGPGAGMATTWYRVPRKGITARNFRDIVVQNVEKGFDSKIVGALNLALSKAGFF